MWLKPAEEVNSSTDNRFLYISREIYCCYTHRIITINGKKIKNNFMCLTCLKLLHGTLTVHANTSLILRTKGTVANSRILDALTSYRHLCPTVIHPDMPLQALIWFTRLTKTSWHGIPKSLTMQCHVIIGGVNL